MLNAMQRYPKQNRWVDLQVDEIMFAIQLVYISTWHGNASQWILLYFTSPSTDSIYDVCLRCAQIIAKLVRNVITESSTWMWFLYMFCLHESLISWAVTKRCGDFKFKTHDKINEMPSKATSWKEIFLLEGVHSNGPGSILMDSDWIEYSINHHALTVGGRRKSSTNSDLIQPRKKQFK